MATIESMKSYTLGNSAIINYQNYFISVIFNLLFRNSSNFLTKAIHLLYRAFEHVIRSMFVYICIIFIIKSTKKDREFTIMANPLL